jgi:hypothetical protein
VVKEKELSYVFGNGFSTFSADTEWPGVGT